MKMQTVEKTATKATPKSAGAKAKATPAKAQAVEKAQAVAVAAKVTPKAAEKAQPVEKAATPAKASGNVHAIAARMVSDAVKHGSTYYKRAIAYHAKAKTKFPRAQCADELAALTLEQVAQVKAQHDSQTLASGSGIGQACFDAYMLA